jgi:hypothetical protein
VALTGLCLRPPASLGFDGPSELFDGGLHLREKLKTSVQLFWLTRVDGLEGSAPVLQATVERTEVLTQDRLHATSTAGATFAETVRLCLEGLDAPTLLVGLGQQVFLLVGRNADCAQSLSSATFR